MLWVAVLFFTLSSSPGGARSGSTSDAENGITGAVPAASARHMPSTAAQYRALQAEIAKSRPQVLEAQQKSKLLKSEADALRQR